MQSKGGGPHTTTTPYASALSAIRRRRTIFFGGDATPTQQQSSAHYDERKKRHDQEERTRAGREKRESLPCNGGKPRVKDARCGKRGGDFGHKGEFAPESETCSGLSSETRRRRCEADTPPPAAAVEKEAKRIRTHAATFPTASTQCGGFFFPRLPIFPNLPFVLTLATPQSVAKPPSALLRWLRRPSHIYHRCRRSPFSLIDFVLG